MPTLLLIHNLIVKKNKKKYYQLFDLLFFTSYSVCKFEILDWVGFIKSILGLMGGMLGQFDFVIFWKASQSTKILQSNPKLTQFFFQFFSSSSSDFTSLCLQFCIYILYSDMININLFTFNAYSMKGALKNIKRRTQRDRREANIDRHFSNR